MNIFVVMGQTGEYSDAVTWPVVAYTREQLAREHATKAGRRAGELNALHQNHDLVFDFDGCDYCKSDDRMDRYGDERIWLSLNEYDPNMKSKYSGTRYHVITVRLTEEPA